MTQQLPGISNLDLQALQELRDDADRRIVELQITGREALIERFEKEALWLGYNGAQALLDGMLASKKKRGRKAKANGTKHRKQRVHSTPNAESADADIT